MTLSSTPWGSSPGSVHTHTMVFASWHQPSNPFSWDGQVHSPGCPCVPSQFKAFTFPSHFDFGKIQKLHGARSGAWWRMWASPCCHQAVSSWMTPSTSILLRVCFLGCVVFSHLVKTLREGATQQLRKGQAWGHTCVPKEGSVSGGLMAVYLFHVTNT